MAEVLGAVRAAVGGSEAWVVGGALRDELLGRPVIDVDIACREPERAARAFARDRAGAPFPLSERHGAWRVVLADGRTVDFTPLPGSILDDLASRDFTLNAMARSLEGEELVDPFGGVADLESRAVRAVGPDVFAADPVRLLRAVRLEDELGFRCDPATEELVRAHAGLVTAPAGERVLAELERLSPAGYRRLHELGLLAALGGSGDRLDRIEAIDRPWFRVVCALGEAVGRLPVSRQLSRYASTLLRAQAPEDGSPRAIHRFRRAAEPWALDALAFVGAGSFAGAVERAREQEPAAPLVRGDELGLAPGPEIGRMLELIAEERAAGTLTTREDAIAFVRRQVRS